MSTDLNPGQQTTPRADFMLSKIVMRKVKEKLRVLWFRLRKFSTLFQPELRGHYSSERIHLFLQYGQTSPTWWAILVCLVSPFPCILVLILIDCAPLASTTEGSSANYLFWARDFLTIGLMTRVILEQFRIAVPGLDISSKQVIIMPIIASGGAVVFMIGMASVVGFPLPFSLVVGINMWFVVLVVCFVYFFGRVLKQDPILLKELFRSIVVLICQVLLTFVYPAYLYGFMHMRPANQKFYVMLLPVIKILARNWISYCLGDKYDLMPQIMIFNVDVFNALYVSSSMENSQSTSTILQMIGLDILLGWVSLLDIEHLMKTIVFLRRKIPTGHALESASFIDIALLIIEEDPQVRDRLRVRRYSPEIRRTGTLSGTNTIFVAALRKSETMSRSCQVLPVDTPSSSIPTAPSEARAASLQVIPQQKPLKNIFSNKERQWFVESSAKVLFTTEFVMLVEYTEVIVPFIYSMYTASMFYLPNADYYPQLQVNPAGLASNLSMVVTYGFIELASLLLMGFLIQRMLRISMLHLLAFVLDRSSRMVQSNLFLWICYTIQNSLEHNGADFSFAFSWLAPA